ncbi:anchored repeat-type ABC transporter ATP-binding subunit [Conexibacter sp. JD483]|uniref:anchored repeat-type ABC transporter ATP-binding subunit n=1 Tax=unclassified Conexibacter TaxID=2627773 RepID=UPI00271E92A8|nr:MULTISPECIES: anchored repeat-type ABC transporter ATP-binding subunit [unclassified Conexibacter]MDO8183964.1 anchored repeat-type ABC transporter ATP-binding subunit [Conexibacter sp. CPCC 205706]MDO8196956.1 anchored repeat-type ABC transporter ATP-binding subunit [Conexibacter sp. CPCC 205762]MDR9369074.1 anchored repeat-type ABC transporter ATP-binding subunit [Conexibacter sp. JD483]
MSAALALREVSVELGGRPVLRDATLEVARGELVGLLGPNGAGKTTLLRTALGLLRPASGRIEVDGDATRHRRGAIGYVPQRHEFAWEFPISVEEVVMSGRSGALGLLRRPGIADWKAVDDALYRVRMTELRERPVGQLSGGQRQRVLVARALALGSPVLLLDEPFTGLDMPTQELLTDLFQSLAREDRAVLMTTHDLAAALYSCDRLALLNGTVLATGTPQQLAAEEALWQQTFGISARSPLLRVLEAVA